MTAGLTHREEVIMLQRKQRYQPTSESHDIGNTKPFASIYQEVGSLRPTRVYAWYPSQLSFLRQLLTFAEPGHATCLNI